MFAEILDRLVRETRAAFAIFCDYEGESIAYAAPGFSDYDVRIAGAHLAAVTIALQRTVAATGQSERLAFVCATDQTTLVVEALPGHYYLVLSVPDPAGVPLARWHAAAVAERFLGEL